MLSYVPKDPGGLRGTAEPDTLPCCRGHSGLLIPFLRTASQPRVCLYCGAGGRVCQSGQATEAPRFTQGVGQGEERTQTKPQRGLASDLGLRLIARPALLRRAPHHPREPCGLLFTYKCSWDGGSLRAELTEPLVGEQGLERSREPRRRECVGVGGQLMLTGGWGSNSTEPGLGFEPSMLRKHKKQKRT